jgi:hypothetical protein
MLSSFACKRTRKLSPAINWLVVFLPILKHMKVPGKDDIPYMKWKIKAMFQTTNQLQFWVVFLFRLDRGGPEGSPWRVPLRPFSIVFSHSHHLRK